MNKKIMAIIKSDKGNFLLLKLNPKWMKTCGWFIVTGSLKEGENEEEAVKREVKEETKLEILDIKPTEYCCIYEWPKNSRRMHKEKAFIVTVKESKPKLSGEHLDYKWLNKEEFLKKISWDESIDSKEKLKKIILESF